MKIITLIVFIIVICVFIFRTTKYYKFKNRQNEQQITEQLINPNRINAYYLEHGELKCNPGKYSISIGHHYLKGKTGTNNIAIGYKPLISPYFVDTTVYCEKCKSFHDIKIPAYSKHMIFKSKCGIEFEVVAKKKQAKTHGQSAL